MLSRLVSVPSLAIVRGVEVQNHGVSMTSARRVLNWNNGSFCLTEVERSLHGF